MNKNNLSSYLDAIVAAIRDLNQGELDLLVSGKGKLVFLASNETQKSIENNLSNTCLIKNEVTKHRNHEKSVMTPTTVGKKGDIPLNLDIIKNQLSECKNREEAITLLSSIGTKEKLVELARSMEVFITKSDRREEVEDKIVEFAVGRRLASEAIRTLKMW
ncbi:MAG: hypothetical protein H7833_20580 [Magnetococcus sp. DMHC-1]|nr:hypothetical protein [Magnetococcales bacterium]